MREVKATRLLYKAKVALRPLNAMLRGLAGRSSPLHVTLRPPKHIAHHGELPTVPCDPRMFRGSWSFPCARLHLCAGMDLSLRTLDMHVAAGELGSLPHREKLLERSRPPPNH